MPDRMLSIAEVAEYLNISAKTVYRLIEKGELPALKVGARWRFKPEDLEAYLERQKQR